jgi:hypothetical protein
MLTRIRRRLPGRGNGPWIVVAAVLVAVLATPFALAAGENRPVRGGARNPSPNASLSYTRETEIIANNNTYGTRQSNKSTRGGGAIYGCRSGAGGTPAGNRPCIRASNLSAGRAFEFDTNSGTEVGRIQSGNVNAAPFTTNATGVATGLNADRVDGKDATQIRDEAVASAVAQNRFAAVTVTGTLTAARGATSASTDPAGAGTYTVVFTDDLSKCAIAGTESTTTDAGAVSIELGADNKTVQVLTRNAAGAAADRPFHLTVTC